MHHGLVYDLWRGQGEAADDFQGLPVGKEDEGRSARWYARGQKNDVQELERPHIVSKGCLMCQSSSEKG